MDTGPRRAIIIGMVITSLFMLSTVTFAAGYYMGYLQAWEESVQWDMTIPQSQRQATAPFVRIDRPA
jgi:hypothetical protein